MAVFIIQSHVLYMDVTMYVCMHASYVHKDVCVAIAILVYNTIHAQSPQCLYITRFS